MGIDISNLFSAPASGIKGIANLFISVGTIIEVDSNTLTCKVLSNQGLLEDVRITFPQLSFGSGIHSLPNVGDICMVGFTVQGTPYILGYSAYNAFTSLRSFDRINLGHNSVVLTSNKRSMLNVSDDIHLVTMSGNHLLLNNNQSDPAIVLEGSRRITIRTGITPDTFTINIIKEVNDNKSTLSITPNNDSKSEPALMFEFKDGKITMKITQELTVEITQELTVKVGGADGSNFVTAQQVADAISAAITGHTHESTKAPGTVYTPPPPPNTTTESESESKSKFEPFAVSITGITNLKTEGI